MNEQDPQLLSNIRMINQIAANQRHFENDEQAAAAVAHHLKKFWARSMKQQIMAFAEADNGQALSPIARRAAVLLRES